MDVPQIELKEIQTGNTEIKKTNAELMSPTVVANKESPQENKETPTPSPQMEKADTGTLTGKQLAINLMKCIAGTGSLTIPYGMWNVLSCLGCDFLGGNYFGSHFIHYRRHFVRHFRLPFSNCVLPIAGSENRCNQDKQRLRPSVLYRACKSAHFTSRRWANLDTGFSTSQT
ncbi:uncharacterized protein [Blastocystis hominis]|uniref:Uncharacterized protein n=1 Tax=Blastocystis hominis TaxID=12968 RepID=D8LV76_BLAHO|nr:uncharacterized protein [Blastocystis hominis]CBK19715.2 unnamed protein product [Blastocystis hominis]|eukprot:XP_012893763.1 uncharacterized protein [Blastocystis hominis]